MCIIIAQKAGAPILGKDVLDNAWERNSDGAGYAFLRNGLIVIRKPFFKKKSFIKAYLRDYEEFGKSSPFIVHLRIATHGSKSIGNTHPHLTGNGESAALAHNGIIDIEIPAGSDMSDTVAMCRQWIDAIDGDELTDGSWNETIEKFIGQGNKLAVISTNGKLAIFNEACGHWSQDGAVWFSNRSYEKWVATSCYVGSWKKGGGTTRVWDKDNKEYVDACGGDDDEDGLHMYLGYGGTYNSHRGDIGNEDYPMIGQSECLDDVTAEEVAAEITSFGGIDDDEAYEYIRQLKRNKGSKYPSVRCLNCNVFFDPRKRDDVKIPWYCRNCQDVVQCGECGDRFHSTYAAERADGDKICTSCVMKEREAEVKAAATEAQRKKVAIARFRSRILKKMAMDHGVPVIEIEASRMRAEIEKRKRDTLDEKIAKRDAQLDALARAAAPDAGAPVVWFRCNGCAQSYNPLVNIRENERADICMVCSRSGVAARFPEPEDSRTVVPIDLYPRTCTKCKVRFADENGYSLMCPACRYKAVPVYTNAPPAKMVKCVECELFFDPIKSGLSVNGHAICHVCWKAEGLKIITPKLLPPPPPKKEKALTCDVCGIVFNNLDGWIMPEGWILCNECGTDKRALDMAMTQEKATQPTEPQPPEEITP